MVTANSTSTETSRSTPWPTPIDPAAYYGVVGDIVQLIEPHSEADPVALLVQWLAAAGTAIGRAPHFRVERTAHRMNLFIGLVGATAKARKGTSFGYVADGLHVPTKTGLSSGEGLIWAVRDPLPALTKHYRPDPGVTDKRLLVVEPEFVSTLQVMAREKNTLSALLRLAWDTGDLLTMTKNTPARATGAHLSVIGHITCDELRRYLTQTEMGNGFANRFLWVCVKRSKSLPEGGNVPEDKLRLLLQWLREDIIPYAATIGPMERDEDARALWHDEYARLSEGQPGLVGSVIARAEAQVLRLSCLYALLDMTSIVRREHLEAALALWNYCERSARYIFGDSLGDPVADAILDALRRRSRGLTRSAITHEVLSGNYSTRQIDVALSLLERRALAFSRQEDSTGGRPAQRWFLLTS